MTSTTTTAATPAWMTRTGYVFSGIVILFLAMDITIKLLRLPIVLETTLQLGWSADSALPLGVLLLACTALYAFPRTQRAWRRAADRLFRRRHRHARASLAHKDAEYSQIRR